MRVGGGLIVSHRHRFVFLAVPRTATHAVRAALTPLLGEEDWQQAALFGRSHSPVPALARIGHGHISARQAQANLAPSVWRSYFKFAVVRDPYDRYVSVCAMLNKRAPAYPGNETTFMKRALATPRFRARVLVRPQVRLLEDDAGRLAVDFVGRYEALQASFDEVCRRIGVHAPALARVNTTAHRPYPAYYDDELLRAATGFYRDDFTAFGYRSARSVECLPCA